MKKAFDIQKKSSRKAVAIFAAFLVIVGSVAGMLNVVRNSQPADATLAGFQAGNIISDYVMGNKGTMSVAQIQSFLNSKGQCNMAVGSGSSAGAVKDSATQAHYTFYSARLSKNITYYYHITNGNFVCLSQETFGSDGLPATGGQTAAQIIYNVAQQYSINPQVLIVLLQKESSLITDAWPNYASSDETNYPAEYKVAAGYGCPDSSVCSSQYYGLTNQLTNAANLFRTVLNGGWSTYPAYQTKYIQYNPDPNCSGSNVYISNYATSALYRYTPYQPNAGALAAGTGTATCGAYGNRNFYNFFTDWFGDTRQGGLLIRTQDNGALYYTDGEYKYSIDSMNILSEFGWSDKDVSYVSQPYIDSLKFWSDDDTRLSPMIVASDSVVYIVSNGTKYPISNMDLLRTLNPTEKILRVPDSLPNTIKTGSYMSDFIKGSDGVVYKIDNGKKKMILQMSVLEQYNPASINQFDDFVIDNYFPSDSPIISGTITVRTEDGTIWLATNDRWDKVTNMDVYNCSGLNGYSNIKSTRINISNNSLGIASCVVSDDKGTNYLLDGNKKYILPSNDFAKYIAISQALLDNIPTNSTAITINGFYQPDGKAFLLTKTSNEKHYVTSMDYINQNKLNFIKLNDNGLNNINNGAYALLNGSMIRSSNGRIGVTYNFESYTINSMDIFTNYSKQGSGTYLSLPDNEFEKFTSGSSITSTKINVNGEYYIIDRGTKVHIASSQIDSFGKDGFVNLASGVIDSMPQKESTRLVKGVYSAVVYYMVNGQKQTLYNMNQVNSLGGNITILSDYNISKL